jgi:uncharacterized paraquat-inducible protein A
MLACSMLLVMILSHLPFVHSELLGIKGSFSALGLKLGIMFVT